MLIDKINLRSKSLNRLPFIFAPEDKKWLAMVDNIETFDDVVSLAKQMLNWQKKQVEQMKKLPDFDNHIIAKTYDLGEDDEDDFDDEDSDNGQGSGSDAEENDDADDEKMISIILVTKKQILNQILTSLVKVNLLILMMMIKKTQKVKQIHMLKVPVVMTLVKNY